jgi:frataxin-like iron-binding protein CyaY
MADKDESKPAEKPAKDRAGEKRGSWVVIDDNDQVILNESSALKALWAAQPFRARAGFWQYGWTREQFLTSLQPAVKP